MYETWRGLEAKTQEGRWYLFPETRVDALLSTTTLHWLAPEHLTRVYRELGELLRPGGIFLNGDNLKFGRHLPSFQKVAQTMWDAFSDLHFFRSISTSDARLSSGG